MGVQNLNAVIAEPPDGDGTVESRGFTVIELFIVLAILGLLAATLIPQVSVAGDVARQEAILKDLHMFRRQIAAFSKDHDGRLPAQGTNSATRVEAEMTGKTTPSGNVSGDGRLGPYLIGDIPRNPYSHADTILVVPGELKEHHYNGSANHGWAYSSTTGEFRANLTDDTTDSSGRRINLL